MKKDLAASLSAATRVQAQANLCWENASSLMFEAGFCEALYVEGVVIARGSSLSHQHAWIVLGNAIIDPTLPEMDVEYFPVFKWAKADFLRLHFERSDKPFFRRADFLTKGVQVEMDAAMRQAEEWARMQS
jgi:hypothetical protein